MVNIIFKLYLKKGEFIKKWSINYLSLSSRYLNKLASTFTNFVKTDYSRSYLGINETN